MSDTKSKLPDLKELGEMGGKLFNDIKKSVFEIIEMYKEKRPEDVETEKPAEVKPKVKVAASVEVEATVKKTAKKEKPAAADGEAGKEK